MGCETVLGLAALGRGRLDEARTHIARSGALARELGLEADVVIADTNLAEISFRARDLDDARRRWEGVLAWHEQRSAPEGGVFALLGLAAIAHAEDRLDEAERAVRAGRAGSPARPDSRSSSATRTSVWPPSPPGAATTPRPRACSGAPTSCSTSSAARPPSSIRRWPRARRPLLARRSGSSAFAIAYAAGRRPG